MNALESQMRAFDTMFDVIRRPSSTPQPIHHACEDFEHALEHGFSLRFVFDYTRESFEDWPEARITHAYILTPNTRTEIPVPLEDLDIGHWTAECAGRVDEMV